MTTTTAIPTAPVECVTDLLAETQVLGGCLLDARQLVQALELVQPGDFHRLVNQMIYSALADMHRSGQSIDMVNLIHHIDQRGLWKHYWATETEAREYIVALVEGTPSPGSTVKYCADVKRASQLRALSMAGADLQRQASDPASDPGELVGHITQQVQAVADARMPGLCSPVLIRLADVKSEEVHWLWPDRVALGKLTLLAGDPDLGKSCISLDIASRVSKGCGWPDNPGAKSKPAGVVLLSAEDGLADTIQARLVAAGADLTRIVALEAVRYPDFESKQDRERPLNLGQDLDALRAAIAQVENCKLVIVDPISAYMGKCDSHVNADVRGVLAPISKLAERCGVAVLAISHLRKGEGSAAYRFIGSLAFIAAARAAFAVVRDEQDSTGTRRLMLPVKNNLTSNRTGLAYMLTSEFTSNGRPAVRWDAQPVTQSADELMADRRDDDGGTRQAAADWLRNVLANGPVEAREVLDHAKADLISERTLRRAKTDIGVIAEKASGAEHGSWLWRLAG